MRRRSRTRRVLKWVLTAGCAILIGLWWASWRPRRPWGTNGFPGRETVVAFGLDRGYYCFDLQRPTHGLYSSSGFHHPAAFDFLNNVGRRPNWMYWPPVKWYRTPPVTVQYPANQFRDHAHAFLEQEAEAAAAVWLPSGSLFVAAWVPVILLAIPTAFLWYRDRRFKPGRCRRCGYDLTGNVSGCCPECGEPVRPDRPASKSSDVKDEDRSTSRSVPHP